MIQYALCAVLVAVFFRLSTIAVEKGYDNIGFVCLVCSSVFIILMIFRFAISDLRSLFRYLEKLIKWVIIG